MDKELSTDKDFYFSRKNHAKRELNVLFPVRDKTQSKEIDDIIRIMEIADGIEHFETKYGRIIPYLFQLKPVTPLTGADDEWTEEVTENGEPFIVNKRALNVVKHNGQAFLLDGKVFSEDGGETFHSTDDSWVAIESFPFQVPFTPEFIVNPTADEVAALETEMETKSQTIQ